MVRARIEGRWSLLSPRLPTPTTNRSSSMSPFTSEPQQRLSPQITATELARYMMATEAAKIGIIRRAKKSVPAQRAPFADARNTIRAFLEKEPRPRRLLHAARNRYERRSQDIGLGLFAREDARRSIDAIDSFARLEEKFGDVAFRPVPPRVASLRLSDVEVTVNVDLLVGADRKDDAQVGGALFRFTGSEDKTDNAAGRRRDMGLYAATLVYLQVERNLAGRRRPHSQLCMSVDVQAEEIHYAPSVFAHRVQNLESACMFIRAMWNVV
jgi:hypothetical protein